MAAGLGFKTFTSGEVLTAADTNGYLMQGINVFANASARSAAITSPQEGQYSFLKDTNALEYYDGAAWVGAPVGDITAVTAGTGISGGGSSGDVTITNSMATTIDAKGDLIVGTADNAFARLAAGNSGESIVADSAATTGLRYQGNYAAGKNKIINGAFDNWQRGTTLSSVASGAYTADRFVVGVSGTSAVTVSAQALPPAAITGYDSPYFFRYAISSIGTGTDFSVTQRIENVQTLSNQVVNFSFWAKADSSRYVTSYMQQNFGSGGSTAVTTTGPGFTVTTSWVRYSGQITLPSISGKTVGTSSYIFAQLYGSTSAGFTFDTWGWQLEAGSVATAFQTATGTIQGELAACQRYYVRFNSGNGYGNLANNGYIPASNFVNSFTQFPVTMRTIPSAVDSSGVGWIDVASATGTASSPSISAAGTSFANVLWTTTGATAARSCWFRDFAGTGAGYLGFSAEL